MKNRIIFYLSNDVHILDLAGPLQVFYESGEYGIPYEIRFVSDQNKKQFSAGLFSDKLTDFAAIEFDKDDILMIPGFSIQSNLEPNKSFDDWLRKAFENKITICSVCTGVFALARAGILNGLECTTHWKYIEALQRQYPKVKVMKNRLFVKNDTIYTSAGITTGIDLALFLIEERHGANFAYQLAKELVMYLRRDSADGQESIYVQYRQHINYQVHSVQEWLIHHLHQKTSIEALAEKVNMSPRNLTRLFKAKTGITIGEYVEKLRVEKALQLLKRNEKMTTISQECGINHPHQLATILKKHTGYIPKELKKLS
ncbi:GlxA family transcriptional regulator [Emticicia agri]|uniref:Helix-turn-helix domain-containing protein n=1 Tax=Emticicia agri TaxID=2492393 RepID=A0A4Q5LUS9_9BACT|nr:helix-turn-helix domain-containing protein [Emticicia agri]RYU93392.1 helix-turn-helix domain-containing protein [Emticicia agri]